MWTSLAIWQNPLQWSEFGQQSRRRLLPCIRVVPWPSGFMDGNMSTPAKIITICILLWVGVHLLLYGYLKRRIAAAKRDKDADA
jgi:hypothetical protein